jgi:hypothetical protein
VIALVLRKREIKDYRVQQETLVLKVCKVFKEMMEQMEQKVPKDLKALQVVL